MGKRKYTVETKKEVVQAVLVGKKTVDEVAQAFYVNKTIVNKWVASYKQSGMEGIEREHRIYTPEFKLQVIEDMRTNQLPFSVHGTQTGLS